MSLDPFTLLLDALCAAYDHRITRLEHRLSRQRIVVQQAYTPLISIGLGQASPLADVSASEDWPWTP